MVSGFAHAPITKGIILLSSVSTLLVSLFRLKHYSHLQVVPHITVYQQYWRLLTCQLAYSNSSELFLSTLLLYNASRSLERTFGSRKFGSFVLITTIIYTALLSVALLTLSWGPLRDVGFLPKQLTEQGRIPGGNFALIFSILHQHSRVVPDLWMIEVGRLRLGDRAVRIWSLGLLLALSQPSMTPLILLLAIASSKIYRSDLLLSSQLKSHRIPRKVHWSLSKVLGPMIGSTRLPTRSWRVEPPRTRTMEERKRRSEKLRRIYFENVGESSYSRGGGGFSFSIASSIHGRRINNDTTGAALLGRQGREEGERRQDQMDRQRSSTSMTSRSLPFGRRWTTDQDLTNLAPRNTDPSSHGMAREEDQQTPPPTTESGGFEETPTRRRHRLENARIQILQEVQRLERLIHPRVVSGTRRGEGEGESSGGGDPESPNPIGIPLHPNAVGGGREILESLESVGLTEYLSQIVRATETGINETNISNLSSMFPDSSRDEIVTSLQMSNGSTEGAIERLLMRVRE
ncbi:hypothetical protein IE53DRAFT_388958 [Violaceomyces palustris]|uniref:Uncharacterized protein n=1 Tax=Violaceomyces palustris TaxID=1673888 RepID=A0ACD0NSQ2_9BASI|nr:hypothetical protein IE53DRAFT_388958 [Violaceomyces palustris]